MIRSFKTNANQPNGNEKACIEYQLIRKPYLGGYRNKITGQIYHNAGVQTAFPPIDIRESNVNLKISRETQTTKQRNRSQQTAVHKATQCEKPGLYISKASDRIVFPQPTYQTAEEKLASLVKKVVIIQRYWRGYKARRTLQRLKNEKLQSEMRQMLRDQKTRRKPQDFSDFLSAHQVHAKRDSEQVYHFLEQWKQDQIAKLDASLSGPLRQATMCKIVQREAQYLAFLNQRRRKFNKEMYHKNIDALLRQVAEPKFWRCTSGKLVEVETATIHRLRKLRDLYYKLGEKVHPKIFVSDRLEKLNKLRCLIQTDEATDTSSQRLSRELLSLTDRELELLARRTSIAKYNSLRYRLKCILLQYILLSYNNLENNCKKNNSEFARNDLNRCQTCSQYKPTSQFLLSAASSLSRSCRSCRKLDNSARTRQENRTHRHLLLRLQNAEAQRGVTEGPAFMLQEPDIKFIVDSIWHRRSALSGLSDFNELTLCRWNVQEEWSPSNCILLTEEEAKIHEQIGLAEEIFAVFFIRKIRHKQAIGKQYFLRLQQLAEITTDHLIPIP